MIIKKIDIRSFGLFEDFQWTKKIGGDPDLDIFKKLNIIYGRNYSGKTTLSRIFRCIEKNELHENYTNCEFSITCSDGSTITQNSLQSGSNIRVYNTDFIKENLSWLQDDVNGHIEPFALLGSDNISATKRIEEIDALFGSVESRTGLRYREDEIKSLLASKETEIQNDEGNLTRELASQANNYIKRDLFFVKQGDTYNINNIKKEILHITSNKSSFERLDENEINSLKKQIEETIKPSINIINITKPKLENLIEECRSILEKKITLSKTIKELIENNILQNWVDKGRELHREKKEFCAFCGGSISNERWEELDNHFSKESDELKEMIRNQIAVLQKSKIYISTYLVNNNIARDNYYALNQDNFDQLNGKWERLVAIYCSTIGLLEEKLNERLDDIFAPKTIDVTLDNPSDDIVRRLAEFNVLSKSNNEKTSTLESDKNNSRNKLRFNELIQFIANIDYEKKINDINEKNKALTNLEEDCKSISEEMSLLEQERKEKELELKDEGKAAEKINDHLNNFFGHDGLRLEPEISVETQQTKFVVKRGSERAVNLSEGECRLISFCYFIAKMEDEINAPDNSKLIIYIDDPISSLDNNHIFFMFSLIEAVICKNKKYEQLFISTHNLDFLKYIKRLTFPERESSSVGHYIVRKKKRGDEAKCILEKMPNYLKDYVTEYNFLFREIYDMAKVVSGDKSKIYENSFTHFYNLPNNMRKFLECYLFYRFPNTDDPLKDHLSKLFENHIPCLVNRIINEYSHLSWGDRGTLVVDVSEAETVSKEILKTIKKKDPEHFKALCHSVGVSEEIDL